MGLVTVYLKLILNKKAITPNFIKIVKGDLMITGLESSHSQSMISEFPDLVLVPSSEDSFPVLKLSKESSEEFPINMESAISTATEYLNALDELGFAVCSATSSTLDAGEDVYKFYVWTMQEGFQN